MKKIVSIALVLIMTLGLFVGCKSNNETTAPAGADLTGTYEITMWVSEKDGVADLFKQQIDAFMAANPGIVIKAQIEGVTEADAGSKVIADVASAPDMYCFAQDQLARLVQAAALAPLGTNAAATVTANNDAGSVAAGTVAGTLYAYPMTSDNGYYLYYDKSIISDADADSLEAIIAACEQNGVKFRYALENAWYTASFFFATGCHSNWTMREDGEFIGVDDDFNSAAGIAAMKGMQKLAQSSCYDSDADIFTDAGAIVTGIWNADAAAAHFGDNLGATDLPSFEVDGKSYHLGSFTGNKLMGVKPQQDAKKQAVLHLLAQYLTNEKCQNERYENFQWGPSNKNAQATEAVQSNLSLAALAKQGEFGQPQGQIHGSWWDIAKLLGADAKAGKDPQQALNEYKAAIEELFKLTPEQKRAFTVIGSVGNTNWDTDFTMTESPDNTWTSVAIEMKAGQEFKVRQGLSWTVNFGADGVKDGGNIVVEADGTYQVVFVWDGENCISITLVPAA